MKLFIPFRDMPIGRKLILIGLLTTALALFSVSLILVARGWVDWRGKTVSEMESYAALIGANAAPSMIFADYDAAAEVLQTVVGNSDIVDAVLYDRDGKVFARYRAPMHQEGNMPLVEPGSRLFTFDQLVVTKPVMLKGEVWGTVYLESDLRGLYADIRRQALLTFITAAGVFLVTLFLFFRLQRAIVEPVVNLSGVMRRVSAQQDYAVRVPVLGKDEVGVLAGAFNDMLAQIQARDEALERHRAHLEEMVAQRTAKLAEMQRITALIIETIPLRVFWKDIDLRYLGCNTAFARDAGKSSPDELLGKDDFDMGWKEQAELYRADDWRVMETNTPKLSYDEPQTTPDGGHIWLRTSKVPLRNETSQIIGVLGVYEDITAYKQMELRLLESEERFRKAFQYSAIGMALVGLDGRWLKVNDALCQIVGYSEPELQDKTYQDITYLDDLQNDLDFVEQLLAGRIDHYQMEKRYFHKDGHIVWIHLSVSLMRDAENKPIHFISQIEDITERRRIEAERRRLSEAVEQSLEAIVLSDTARSIIYVNPSFTQLFGYSAQEVLGQSVDLLAVDGYPAPYQTAEIALAQGAYSGETMRRSKDGRAILVLLNVAVVRDEHNEISGYVGTMTDLTELKRAEMEAHQRMVELTHANAELRELNAKLAQAQIQLVQSEKMASIGMLAAGVAHEINNPIGYIRSNLGTLGNYIGNFIDVLDAYEKAERSMPDRSALFAGTDELKEKVDISYIRQDVMALLHESNEGVERVTKIVQDLKDFSRIETEEKWVSENVHHGIDSTLNVIWNELKYKCEVVKEYGELPDIDCLPSQLNQVFMNLLVNAAQSIETRGRITIRTGREGDRVWVEVSDTGQGISPENIPHLFDPFFTTKPVGKGTGLGLSVSYNIVEKHHGKIEVASEVGKGSTFRVWLPIRQQATKENA
ncbi:MAG TPA: PAS domain S-box protein [Gallionella sp.]|nr:PAS domain S-box protein [Gallionella sp.]